MTTLRVIIVVTVGVIAAWLLLALAVYSKPTRITLINEASEAVTSGHVTHGRRSFEFDAIKAGGSRSIDFLPNEGGLSVTATLESGRTVSSGNLGYVTDGVVLNFVVKITDQSIELAARKVVEKPKD